MIISVEDKFDDLYNKLKNMGFEVYRFSDRIVADVVIYSGASTSLISLNSPEFNGSQNGAFLINGDYKNIFEIESMIKNKTYSSLF